MYGMRPSGLATPREVHSVHILGGQKLIVVEAGALPQSVRGRSGERKEGAVGGVGAFVVCVGIYVD